MRGILGQSGLFDRGKVVKIVIDPTKGGATAHEMTAPALVIAAHESARPYVETQYSDGSTRRFPAALPDAIATKYLDYRDWGLPPLAGITSAPLLAEDGSIRTALGYDILTGMWCENIPDVADLVPAKPTKDDAARALAVIRETFQTFPFEDASAIDAGNGVRTVDLKKPPGLDESAFLCSLMTGVCRPCLWLAPATVVHGPQMSGAGVGKGLLVRSMFQIAFGRQPHAVARAATAEEQEKRIATELIEAGPSIFLDNFNNLTFKSASLESALTERPSRVRDFGKLRSVTLNTVAFIAITGNGLIISQDLVRRVVEIVSRRLHGASRTASVRGQGRRFHRRRRQTPNGADGRVADRLAVGASKRSRAGAGARQLRAMVQLGARSVARPRLHGPGRTHRREQAARPVATVDHADIRHLAATSRRPTRRRRRFA